MNRNATLFLVIGIAVAAVLFWYFKPQSPTEVPGEMPPSPVQPALSAPAVTPANTIYEWKVEHGKRVSGPETVQVRQGESVMLRLTSDHDDELHLHGYDLQLQLQANKPASLLVQAEHSGRFELELHHAHVDLAVLEVQPK